MDDVTRRSVGADETVAAGTTRPSGSDEATILSSTSGDQPTVLSGAGDEATVLSSAGASGRVPSPRISPGQAFGPYRIERVLGRGGMGEVYEAEHIEHARHVALKVLTARFTGIEEREQFLREGAIAASINHPHTVYVYGSEEVDGSPVITMELVAGGTLRDRVQAQGALPPAEAVDLILQVISGLAAAEKAGILHRDVKPANCFVDRDGIVKVGDFGLSISTAASQRATGMFQGTPQYAPPEQIRGEPLDVRADIYSVGATLFYLLTGQPPFDDQDLTTLITRVTVEAPRSPREMKAGVPEALGQIVMRCLAKDRSVRPASYAALEKELQPFSSIAPVPAGLGRRFAAGVADQVVFAMLIGPINLYLAFMVGQRTVARFAPFHTLIWILYFGFLEGRGGASLGKRLFGLRVNRTDGQRLDLARAFVRATIYEAPNLIGLIPLLMLGVDRWAQYTIENPALAVGITVADYLVLALLFSTARRRNGFAAIQDRVTDTRVVRIQTHAARETSRLPDSAALRPSQHGREMGPYEIAGTLGSSAGGELLVGRDPRLGRQVWVHVFPPGAPAVPAVLRNLGRPGRLRWLSGRRTETEAWDAYEAFGGVPLVTLDRPQPWLVVRRWLHDLAVEVQSGLGDGSLAAIPLDLNHVWVTPDGHARLTDFPAPNTPDSANAAAHASLASAQTLLFGTAVKGLSGRTAAEGGSLPVLPLSARRLLDALAQGELKSAADVVSRTAVQVAHADRVVPWRRAASIAICALFVAFLGFLGQMTGVVMQRMAASQPDLAALGDALTRLSELSAAPNPAAADEREALEVYIAGRFRARITDETVWTNPVSYQRLKSHRALANDVIARHPAVTPAELDAATARLGTFIDQLAKASEAQQRQAGKARTAATGGMIMVGLVLLAGFALVFGFFLKSGLLLRAFGMAVVDAQGRPASRLRATWRALVTWAPAIAAAAIAFSYGVLLDVPRSQQHPVWTTLAVVAALVFVTGATVAALRPTRAWQDRLAGTFVVPV